MKICVVISNRSEICMGPGWWLVNSRGGSDVNGCKIKLDSPGRVKVKKVQKQEG